jgi:phosphoglycerol transferase MdoB-like AlkP superfamily enzyme
MDTYDIPEEDDEDFVGLGLSDKSFFKQFIPKLKKIKEENSLYYGTVITLSNHSPFNDIAKYGEFDVTMKYKYKNKKGETITDNAPYLEGTSMGNYIKSSHYADEALGELFKMLKEENLLENTVVILYGDHEARLSKKQFDLLYNYDPKTNSIKDEDEEDYVSMDNYYYDLLKNTPFIIWSAEEEYNMVVDKTMGMYDVLPTMANLFGFTESYALGHDVFSKEEGIVVFPSGNVLTDKVYYNNLNEEYISFTEDPLSEDYISNLRDYADMILEVSNGIIMHDLIKNEKNNLGECNNEKKTKVKSR